MKLEKVLTLFVLFDFCLACLGLAVEYGLEPSDSPPVGMPLFVLWLAAVISTVLAWVGLLALLRPARSLYLVSWGAYLLLLLLRGPVTDTSAGYVVQNLSALTGGALLALVYLTDLRTRFRTVGEVFGAPVRTAA